jgi:long-chain fatty acid transport protein
VTKIRADIIVGTLLFCLAASPVLANGFKIMGVRSTRATSMGEAFVVQADDPSATAFNPAGLVQLKGTQLSVAATYTNGWCKHESPAGGKEGVLDKWQTVPVFYLTSDFGSESVTAGLGVTAPNGLSSEWSDTGFARYVSTYSDLRVIDINPSVGWRVNEKVALGFGISYYTSEVTMESMVDYGLLAGMPGALDGKRELGGDADGWGFDMGVLWFVDERHSLGAFYKSSYELDYSGSVELTDIPAFIGGPLGIGTSYKSNMDASFDFPAVVIVGYAYRPTKKLKLELNLDWTNWDVLNSVPVTVKSPLPGLLPAGMSLAYGYDDTIVYKLGVEYAVSDKVKIRGGYMHSPNATPEETFRPSLPDTDVNFLTAGVGYESGKLSLDFAFQFLLYDDRDVDNNVDANETISSSSVDGEYENSAIGYSVTITYRF